MSKILANQIANYGDNSPVEVKEGVNIPAGKPLQASGTSGSSGQVLSSTGSSIEWIDVFDRDYNSLSNLPTIPSSQVQSDWNAVGGIATILNKPVIPAQPSVSVVNVSGNGNLTYNQANGEFVFTPPDLSSFATTTDVSTAVTNSSDWDTAYGWGNHALSGYATQTYVNTAVTNSSDWDTAYGWGDHSLAGYLTSTTDTLQQVTGRGATTTEQIVANGGIRALNITSGTLNDLSIRHDNNDSKSYVSHQNLDADFYVESVKSLYVNAGRDGDPGGVYLQYNDSTKLSVTSSGVNVGDLFVSGSTDLTSGDLADIDLTIAPQDGQVLKWIAANSKWEPANDLQGSSAGLALEDFSVATLSAGTNALAYNPANGVFSYTPPDLSDYDTAYGWGDHSVVGYLTTETDPVFSAHVASNILQTNINNWNNAYTAYGWGDHSLAGYLTSYTESDTLADVTGRGATSLDKITLNSGTSNPILDFQLSGVLRGSITPDTTALTISVSSTSDLHLQCNDQGGTNSDVVITSGGAVGTYPNGNAIRMAVFTGTGSAELWYQDAKKLETTGTGVTVSGNLLYSNNYATTGDLPNATTYHGMFAHVHAEGHGYFAHAGAWTQLLDTTSALSDLNNVSVSSPNVDDVLTWDGSSWGPAESTGGGGANVTISDTAPGSASAGDLWWESDKGRLKIYYNDTDSTQWVDASPPLTNANVPVHVGEVELWQGGNQITWLGSGGVTAAIRATEGGGGFQSPCIRVTFAQPFSSSDSYTIQATVYNPSPIGHVYQTSIRKTGPQHFDFQVYNLTDSVVATDFKVAITIYAI